MVYIKEFRRVYIRFIGLKKTLEFSGKLFGSPDFKASSAWYKNFKLMHSIWKLENQKEISSEDGKSSFK